jgi:hypothetical protein
MEELYNAGSCRTQLEHFTERELAPPIGYKNLDIIEALRPRQTISHIVECGLQPTARIAHI